MRPGALRISCLQAQPAMPTGLQSGQISTCCILVVERQLSRGLCQPHSRDAQLSLQKVLQFWLLLPFPDMPAAMSSRLEHNRLGEDVLLVAVSPMRAATMGPESALLHATALCK